MNKEGGEQVYGQKKEMQDCSTLCILKYIKKVESVCVGSYVQEEREKLQQK